MTTRPWAMLLVAFCTLLTASGQYFYKRAADSIVFSFPQIALNSDLWIGLVFYGLGAALFVVSLRAGELSILYPIVSLSFVWVTLIAAVFLAEPLSIFKIGGISFILVGISLIGIGAK